MPETVRELFAVLPERFDPADWEGHDVTMNFDISGDEASQWTAHIVDGTLAIQEGVAPNPDMTMITSDEDLLAMVNGDLNPVSAFMQGRVKIKGEMKWGLKLQSLLNA